MDWPGYDNSKIRRGIVLRLRLHAAALVQLGAWRVHGLAAQRLAAEQGIAPDVVLVDEAAGAMISAKVEGVPFGMALAQPDIRPRALRNLSETLARLHAIPAPDLPPFDPGDGAMSGAECQLSLRQRRSCHDAATEVGASNPGRGNSIRREDRRLSKGRVVTP